MRYVYFTIGYLTALVTLLIASCTYTPLEAGGSECGGMYNPCYVKIID